MLTTRFALAALAVLVLVAGAFGFTRLTAVNAPGSSSAPTPVVTPVVTPAASASPLNVAGGYANLPGWIVFEHFGKKPDGSSATFDSDQRWIWLVHPDGTGLHELAPNTTAGKVSPDISPDGTTVIFASWERNSKIYQAPIDGGTPTPLNIACPAKAGSECNLGDPAYSADGKQVAFVRGQYSPTSVATEIDVYDLASGTTRAIATTRSANIANQPTWSPDGRQIAYHLDTVAGPEDAITKVRIEVVNVDGGGLHELPVPSGAARAGDPDFAPDGSLIVFSTFPNREGEGQGGATGIYTIHPDGTGLTNVCGSCLGGGIAPSWTPDGKHILFWGYRSWALMDPDGGNIAHINQPKLTWYGDKLGYGYFAELQPTP